MEKRKKIGLGIGITIIGIAIFVILGSISPFSTTPPLKVGGLIATSVSSTAIDLVWNSMNETNFVVLGDYGTDTSREADVATLIENQRGPRNLQFIITTGDNAYNAPDFDNKVGKYYSSWISNYTGAFEPGNATNRFWPSIGNHDYVPAHICCNDKSYLDYFNATDPTVLIESSSDNATYYNFVFDDIEFFAFNSGFEGFQLNGTGNDTDFLIHEATQIKWLEGALRNSNALFQVVYLHHAPFTNTQLKSTDLRIPNVYFSDWGADIVFSGHIHSYERFDGTVNSDNIVHVVQGLGGRDTDHDTLFFDEPGGNAEWEEPGTVVKYDEDNGASFVKVNMTHMEVETISVAGVQIDFFSIPSGIDKITGYQIERRTCDGSYSIIVANTASTDLFYNDIGLDSETCYDYRVSALNSNIGPASNNSSATTN